MKRMFLACLVSCGCLLLMFEMAQGAPIFWGPTPYLSAADIPTGFYAGGIPAVLEDFEDGNLGFRITASAGAPIGTANGRLLGLIDSVGNGADPYVGNTWYVENGSLGVTFTLFVPVTAAGLVWTDGRGVTTFEAFRGSISLGTLRANIADNSVFGTTGEDRFFGIQDLDGITSIKMSNTWGGIEVDHLQYGIAPSANAVVPEPGTLLLLAIGMIGLVGASRKMKS